MTEPLTSGCLCGAVRYDILAPLSSHDGNQPMPR